MTTLISITKKDNKEKANESDMTNWKYMWNDILSDPDFRCWITGKTAGGYYQLFKNTKIENDTPKGCSTKKGTFYMKFGKLGHYVAYEMKAKEILIFDSSHSTGNENGIYSECLLGFTKTIKSKFSPNIKFVEDFGTPQILKGDSFCQTWSLAYLLGSPTKKIIKEITVTNRIEILYKLCKKIIDSRVFKEICETQQEWIEKAFTENKSPKKWTAKYFLHFSRDVMNLESFKYLFT
jgi:hypothetical protein